MHHDCPKCSQPMTAGHIRDMGLNPELLTWSEGQAQRNTLGSIETSRVRYSVEAYRCPNCGLVEMYALERKY